jgi:hypothetical protein
LPTAKQFVALVHDTAESWLDDALDGFALATIVQLVPFQRWIRAVTDPELPVKSPTAKQLVVVAHDTLTRWAFGGPGGLGLATIDHVTAAFAGVPNATRPSTTKTAIRALVTRPRVPARSRLDTSIAIPANVR